MPPAKKVAAPPFSGGQPVVFGGNNKFPKFNDGDVKIVIKKGMSYILHRTILTNSSAVLADLLDEENIGLAAAQNPILKVRQQLTLTHNSGSWHENGAQIDCIFTPVILGGDGKPVDGSPKPLCRQDGKEEEEIPEFVLAFDTVFRALYNEPIYIGNAQTASLTELLSLALTVTAVAEYLECTHIVTQAIESTLLATGQTLFRAISGNPIAWLAFGNRIRSKVIFKEALIHAAGQFGMSTVQNAKDEVVPEEVVTVLNDKVEKLQEMVSKAENHFFSYYPQAIMRVRPAALDQRDSISRASYSNDILSWMALAIFRHWLGECVTQDFTHHAEDLGWEFIMAINTGGEAYLNAEELKHFHVRFPMSAKAAACINVRLGDIKEAVKQWTVRPLQNNSQLDLTKANIKYFTSTEVEEKDYPWVNAVDAVDDSNADEDDEYGFADDNIVGRARPDGLDEEVMDELERNATDMYGVEDDKHAVGAGKSQNDGDDDLSGAPMSDDGNDRNDDNEDVPDYDEDVRGLGYYAEKEDQQAATDRLNLNQDPARREGARSLVEFSRNETLFADGQGAAVPPPSSRQASPASNATEEMDPSVYEQYLQAKEQQRLANVRLGKRKAVDTDLENIHFYE